MLKDFELLGLKVRDKVTGFEGIVACMSYDLYGCIQAIVQPEYRDKEKELPKGIWFDTKRLEVLSQTPVMEIPDFAPAASVRGPAEKPKGRL